MSNPNALNVFRIIADLSHTTSKCILIWAIHANASAEGVSLITQALYALVFCTRYLDLFSTKVFEQDHPAPLIIWNFTLKIFYILSSLYILFIMLRVYGRTHERGKAWKFGYACVGGSALLSPIIMLILSRKQDLAFWRFELIWTFSEILESVCILPQLLLLRQTSVPTVIDSFYLVTLGSYRFFYFPNWILIGAQDPRRIPWVSVVFGVIQTAFYIDFAWVYYSRQRVKLRNGALVDSEDFGRGWLVSKILGRAGFKGADYDGPVDGRAARYVDPEDAFGSEDVDDVESGAGGINRPRPVGSQGGWGKRGVSVSADDEDDAPVASGGASKKAQKGQPEERRGMLEDLDDDHDAIDDNVGGHSEWK